MNKQLLALELIKAWAGQRNCNSCFSVFLDYYNKALKELDYIDELKEEHDEKIRSNIDLLEKLEEKEELQQRINKAIKYIYKTQEGFVRTDKLLEILEGNEENE